MLDKLCGMNITYMRYSFDYFLNSLKKLDVSFMELWGGAPHFLISDMTHHKAKEVQRKIQTRNIKIEVFTPEQCMYPINIASSDKSIRDRSINYFLKSIDIADSLEVGKMLITSGLGYFDGNKEHTWKRSKEALNQISKYAEEKKVELLLEPLSVYESNLVTDLTTLKQMLLEVDSDQFKPMVDIAPMTLEQESLEDYFSEFSANLSHVHFVDTNLFHEHLPLGEGDTDIANNLKIIHKHNYTGKLTLELTGPAQTFTPHKALEKSINYISMLEKERKLK